MERKLFGYLGKNHFLTTVLILGILWFLLQIQDILIAGFIAYIIMAALSPAVIFLHKKGVPKTISVILPPVVAILFISLLVFPLIPFFLSQVQSLIVSFPTYLDQAAKSIGITIDTQGIQTFITSQLAAIGRNAFLVTGRVFGGVLSALTIFVVTFYLLFDGDRIKKAIASLFPKKLEGKIFQTLQLVDEKLGAWLRGQIVLSIFIGVITWVALITVGIKVALPLAVIAGILEIVPTIGPIIAAIPAIIIALTISPTTAIIVAALYFAIQIIENNILVPRIMQQAVGLNPVVVIICILAGGELMGVIGALLSIPFLSAVIVLFRSLKEAE